MKKGYIYILTNRKNGTLYVGVTSNLSKRITEHKLKLADGFTAKYGLNMLVYYEEAESIQDAIQKEKQLKSGNRKQKLMLIESLNPYWKDLSDEIE